MKFIRTVVLNDEHNQPIDILQDEDGFWWKWNLWDGDDNGPFKSEYEAHQNAEEFCGAGGCE